MCDSANVPLHCNLTIVSYLGLVFQKICTNEELIQTAEDVEKRAVENYTISKDV